MVNRVGASRLAATVWPRSTSRPITTPSIGAGDHGAREIDPRLVQLRGLLPFGRLRVQQVGIGHQLAGLGGDNRLLGDLHLGLGCAQVRCS